MADNDLFQNDDNQEVEPFRVDPDKDYLTELVGPDKKFKTEADLARGKVESDAFITHLTREMKNLREDYLKLREEGASRARLEEVLDQIKELKSASNNQPDDGIVNEADIKQSAFDPEQINTLIATKLREAEVKKIRDNNMKIVQDKLRERFGENFGSALREQTRNLGLDEDFVKNLAETSPEALFRTLGLNENKDRNNFQAPPHTQRMSSTSMTSKSNQPTYSFYEEMRLKEPKKYYDQKTQVQMHKDAQRLGEAFFDTD
jgi:hypothetical protein